MALENTVLHSMPLLILSIKYNFIWTKKYTCSIFIDLKKALDTVDHDILLNKLEHYGIRGIANSCVCSYCIFKIDAKQHKLADVLLKLRLAPVVSHKVLCWVLFCFYYTSTIFQIRLINWISSFLLMIRTFCMLIRVWARSKKRCLKNLQMYVIG